MLNEKNGELINEDFAYCRLAHWGKNRRLR